MTCRLFLILLLAFVSGLARAADAPIKNAFELDLFKTRFEHEVSFRGAAIEVAWAAEKLCDSTTEIEPFVLLSVHALRRRLSSRDLELFSQATGMDENWRVVWLDEGAPDELGLGDVVLEVNGRKLPGSGTRFELGNLFGAGSVVSTVTCCKLNRPCPCCRPAALGLDRCTRRPCADQAPVNKPRPSCSASQVPSKPRMLGSQSPSCSWPKTGMPSGAWLSVMRTPCAARAAWKFLCVRGMW